MGKVLVTGAASVAAAAAMLSVGPSSIGEDVAARAKAMIEEAARLRERKAQGSRSRYIGGWKPSGSNPAPDRVEGKAAARRRRQMEKGQLRASPAEPKQESP